MPVTTVLRRCLLTSIAAAALLGPLAVATAGTAATGGSAQPVQLSIKPVGSPGQYFDLEIRPGQQRRLTVALGNNGPVRVRALTYPADVYSIVNGGFGAALRGSLVSGSTSWLSYPTGELTLNPGRAAVREFTLTIPPGTPSGEYVTSIVLENAVPLHGTGTVALDQIIRQAVAVAIRVPGPLRPSLGIGAASHKVAAARSVVAVGVTNTGNQMLKPAAALTIHDHGGTLVAHATVPMDSFYAGTTTKVEITLEEQLSPGRYSADLVLKDAETGAQATARDLPFMVAPPASQTGPNGVSQQVFDVLQSPGRGLGLPAVLAAVALLAITVVLVRRRRRRARPSLRPGRRRAGTTPTIPSAPPVPASVATLAQPLPTRPSPHSQPGRRRAPRHGGRARTRV
jgi:hypothetical protein